MQQRPLSSFIAILLHELCSKATKENVRKLYNAHGVRKFTTKVRNSRKAEEFKLTLKTKIGTYEQVDFSTKWNKYKVKIER